MQLGGAAQLSTSAAAWRPQQHTLPILLLALLLVLAPATGTGTGTGTLGTVNSFSTPNAAIQFTLPVAQAPSSSVLRANPGGLAPSPISGPESNVTATELRDTRAATDEASETAWTGASAQGLRQPTLGTRATDVEPPQPAAATAADASVPVPALAMQGTEGVESTTPPAAVADDDAAVPAVSSGAPALQAGAPPASSSTTLTAREAGLLAATNLERERAGLPALRMNATLTAIARARVQDMAANDYFAHFGPEGQSAFALVADAGLRFSAIGENLARVRGDETSSVEFAIQNFMASSMHRGNVLNDRYAQVGIGVAFNDVGFVLFALVFASE